VVWTGRGFDAVDTGTCYRPRQSGDLMYLTERLLTGWMAWGFDVVGTTFLGWMVWGFDVVDTETCYRLDGPGI